MDAINMQSSMRKQEHSNDFATLDELNRHFIRSVAESDADWFEKHCDEDFVNSNPDGTLSERAAFIERIGKPSGLSDLAASDIRIRIIGDCAIIHARTTYVGPDGQAGAGRYTDVWLRRPQGWRCVAAHVTRAI
jgi:ketosteroid isomerase-like protein